MPSTITMNRSPDGSVSFNPCKLISEKLSLLLPRHFGRWLAGISLALAKLDAFTLTSVLSLIGRGGKEGFCQVVQILDWTLKDFEDEARVGERFPLENGEGVVDVNGVSHAVEDARDAGGTGEGPEGFPGKRFLAFIFR